MTEKEREIWIGETRYYLGEDNIIYVTVVGEVDEKTATSLIEAGLKLANMVKGKVKTLVDLNKATGQASKARKLFEEALEYEKADKIAFFGMHPVARVIASFTMGISRKEDMRFFKTKEEALKWFKE